MSKELSDLIAKRYIARKDVKAIQHSDGSWSPHTVTGKHDGARIPWRREDLEAHLSGNQTFGHYLLDTDSTCKLFAFDIDLEQKGILPNCWPAAIESEHFNKEQWYEETDLRAAWRDRRNPGRAWTKLQFKIIGLKLMKAIYEELEISCAMAYSGGKGLHVYGFTGLISAVEAREGAQIVLDACGVFEASRGNNFFKHKDLDPVTGMPNLSIELFPKQDSLENKDLGNLMALSLGKNQKNIKDKKFFLDPNAPLGVMAPVDPIWALTTENPWADHG